MNQEIPSWYTCNYCEKTVLKLTSDGLCEGCDRILVPQVRRVVQTIMESDEKISRSKKIETKLSQLEFIENTVKNYLLPLEEKGIKATNQTSDQILDQVGNWRDEIIVKYLKDLVRKVKIKIKKTKSEELKITTCSKVLKEITELKEKVSKNDTIFKFETKVKQLIDEIKLNAFHGATNSTQNQTIVESDSNQKELIHKSFVYWV